jgi:acyl-CoA thioester hydrolase
MPGHRFLHRELVQFSDTDMAGIMHFANFFRFMERAEHAFFRSLGFSVMDNAVPKDERVGWPRVHASCDYFAPLRFEDQVEIEVLIEEIRTRSLRYLFRVRKLDGTLCAEGRIAIVCTRKDRATGQMKAVEIPLRIRERIETAPPELLKSARNPSPVAA